MDRGVLTDGADYIFLDGRPTPFGMKQKRKLLLQREYAVSLDKTTIILLIIILRYSQWFLINIQKKIVALSESLDIAKERYSKNVGEKDEETKQILDRKLKPKGNKQF